MVIIHVIVAFENVDDVKRLLEQIELQEDIYSTIVCVDNSTINFLAFQKLFKQFASKYKANVYYLKNSTNEGSAKGFAIGMQKAYELGADWIWLHDQDGFPHRECLSSLINSFDKEKILAPCVIGEDNQRIKVFSAQVDRLDSWIPVEISGTKTKVDICGTAGLIINKEVINKIGVYDYEHYFVGMEDFDYCLRAKHYGFKLKIIKGANYFHPNKWIVKKWKLKRRINYFGEWSKNENRIMGGHIYFNMIHSKNLFIPSLLYSLFKLSLKFTSENEINVKETFSLYLSGLKNRYKSNKKITIEISHLKWTVY